MSKKEDIERWAQFIVPAVFKAEDALHKKHPEWHDRLKAAKKDNAPQVAEEYCRAIAEEIVNNTQNN